MFKSVQLLKDFHKLPEAYREIVFFSEGPGYWTTFFPIVLELEKRDIPFSYLSLDEKDPGIMRGTKNCAGFFLGRGSGFVYFTCMMQAGVVIMTTPGLQSLNLKRSPDVQHYIHLVHSPTGMGFYRKYSFDHFDTVMCAGPHQISDIRQLEQIRKGKKKQLLETGCVYMDILKAKKERKKAQIDASPTGKATVLIAPTWGSNGALGRYGTGLIKPLLTAGFKVILRPHPQQHRSEKKLLSRIRKALASEKNFVWDNHFSGHESMEQSNIMISDFSGIIFDYAFVYEKPVLTLAYELTTAKFDQEDLDGPVWEQEMCHQLGGEISPDDMQSLPERIEKKMLQENNNKLLPELRKKSLFNYGRTVDVAVNQILEIVENVLR